MRKLWLLAAVLAAMLALGALNGCAEEKGGLSVVASFYPMADFARKVGGERVEVYTLVPAGAEPHDWEPSPADIVRLEKAQVFVYSGAGMEHWAEDVVSSLGNKSLVVVEASRGIALHADADHEDEAEADGSDTGDGDPHVWLDPENAKAQMAVIRDGLIQADPDGKGVYDANYEKYALELDALDAEFREGLKDLARRDIVVAHAAYGYLCDAYDLQQVAIEGLSPDSEPSPARVAEIIDFARAHDVRVIFFESLVNPKIAESIAAQVGARTDVLSPLEGLTDDEAAAGEDYFSVMRKNLAALKAALS